MIEERVDTHHSFANDRAAGLQGMSYRGTGARLA
jgi:hypothetical protein